MKEFLKNIIKEEYKKLNEVSSELHDIVKRNYSDKRITISRTPNIRFQDKKDKLFPSPKPNGLWYGIGSSWIDYIKSEGMEDWDYDHVFDLTLDESKLLKITNIDELDEFNKIYSIKSDNDFMRDYKIDWELVGESYSGIEIAPYIWKGRMKYMWYYGWDVPSGCIWSKDAIKEVKKINIP
jgi:hypothetical protein